MDSGAFACPISAKWDKNTQNSRKMHLKWKTWSTLTLCKNGCMHNLFTLLLLLILHPPSIEKGLGTQIKFRIHEIKNQQVLMARQPFWHQPSSLIRDWDPQCMREITELVGCLRQPGLIVQNLKYSQNVLILERKITFYKLSSNFQTNTPHPFTNFTQSLKHLLH